MAFVKKNSFVHDNNGGIREEKTLALYANVFRNAYERRRNGSKVDWKRTRTLSFTISLHLSRGCCSRLIFVVFSLGGLLHTVIYRILLSCVATELSLKPIIWVSQSDGSPKCSFPNNPMKLILPEFQSRSNHFSIIWVSLDKFAESQQQHPRT